MNMVIWIGVLAAFATGIAIGSQGTLSSRLGAMLGPLKTGMFTNLVCGILAALFLLVQYLTQGKTAWAVPRAALGMLVVSGALGVILVVGTSFALQRTGVTAGMAAIILGQLFISTVVDTAGWGGVQPIPLTFQRVLGLLVMAIAVWLLLPRK